MSAADPPEPADDPAPADQKPVDPAPADQEPVDLKPPRRLTFAGTVVRQALLGLGIATVVVLLLLFAGSEDRGFIYIDF